jgi:hypothetical protein
LSAWRPAGQPTVGHIWYGPWGAAQSPDHHTYDPTVEAALPIIRSAVAKFQVRERLAEIGRQSTRQRHLDDSAAHHQTQGFGEC